MSCENIQELISEFLDGELAESQDNEVFSHLGRCQLCRRFMRTSMSVRSSLIEFEPVPVPRTLDARIEAMQVRGITPRTSLVRNIQRLLSRRLLIPAPVAIASAIILILTLAWSGSLFFSDRANVYNIVAHQAQIIALPEVEVQAIIPAPENNVH